MAENKYYCFCDNGCKYETMSKEQTLTAIAQAIESGKITNVDTGFITTVKTINGTPLKFFVGAQSEFELLTDEQKNNLFAIITNDVTKDGLLETIEELKTDVNGLSTTLADGSFVVKNAEHAKTATSLRKNEQDVGVYEYDAVVGNLHTFFGFNKGKSYLVSLVYNTGTNSSKCLSCVISIPKNFKEGDVCQSSSMRAQNLDIYLYLNYCDLTNTVIGTFKGFQYLTIFQDKIHEDTSVDDDIYKKPCKMYYHEISSIV